MIDHPASKLRFIRKYVAVIEVLIPKDHISDFYIRS